MEKTLRAISKVFKKAEINTEDTEHTAYVFERPPHAYPLFMAARVKTAFAGVTVPQVSVGISGDTDKYIKQQHIDQAGDLLGMTQGTYCDAFKIGYMKTPSDSETIIATFSSSTGNWSDLSAGEIEFLLVYAE
jgi:hypothetical protein